MLHYCVLSPRPPFFLFSFFSPLPSVWAHYSLLSAFILPGAKYRPYSGQVLSNMTSYNAILAKTMCLQGIYLHNLVERVKPVLPNHSLQHIRGGVDKYLARPGRKQATATKLGIYSTYSPRSSIHFLARCSNFASHSKKYSEGCPSNHFSAAVMTSTSEEK